MIWFAKRLLTRSLFRRRSSLLQARFSACVLKISSKPNVEKSSDHGAIYFTSSEAGGKISYDPGHLPVGGHPIETFDYFGPHGHDAALKCVSINVSSRTTDQDPNNERLREEYRGAFNEWALQVSRLQQTEGTSPDRPIDEAAEGRAAAAETAYRRTRDRLTDEMRVDAPKPEALP